MALWRRFGSAGLESLSYRCKRRYSIFPGVGAPSARSAFWTLDEPFSRGSSMLCYAQFRSFMSSGQAKTTSKADGKGGDWKNAKVEDDWGVRINEAIKEHEVRLVTDQGHRIVSIQEALYLARKHELDLVEVQKKVKVDAEGHLPVFKPAVCRLMDYCKEKYKQDVKEKERVKVKAVSALRNGENKEVRFKAKTESKDLKIKAESVKRLMERGYRVKCTAISTGKDGEDMGGLLLNLLSLIEDISVVESGPHLDTKNAYVIVKHIKFAMKKGKKVSKALETVANVLSSRSIAAKDEDGIHAVETETEAPSKQIESKAGIGFNSTPQPEPSIIESNRYSRGSKPAYGEGISPSKGSTRRIPEQSFRKEVNATDNTKAGIGFTSASQPEPPIIEANRYSRGSRPAYSKHIVGKEGEARPQAHHFSSPSSPRRGVFDSSLQGTGAGNPNTSSNSPQQRYGVFRSAKSSTSGVDQRPSVSDGNSSPESSSYGIFSVPKIGNASPPSPRFGIFTPSKKAPAGDGNVSEKN